MKQDERACPKCAETIKKAARLCKHCGSVVEPEGAASAPQATKKSKTAGGLFGKIMGSIFSMGLASSLVIVCGFVLICCCVGGLVDETPEQRARREARRVSQDARREEQRAERREAITARSKALATTGAQDKWCGTLNAAAAKYSKGANDLQRSAVRGERKRTMAALGGKLRGFKGRIANLTTSGDGHGILEVDLYGCLDFSARTTNNAITEAIQGESMIRQGTDLYQTLSGLAVGDSIEFDADALRDPTGVDAFANQALTEHGSMTGMAVIVRFRRVAKVEVP